MTVYTRTQLASSASTAIRRELRETRAPGIAPQLAVQRRHRQSHDHEVQPAAALLDPEAAVGDMDHVAARSRRRSGNAQQAAHREYGELLQGIAELRPGGQREAEERDGKDQQPRHRPAERRSGTASQKSDRERA